MCPAGRMLPRSFSATPKTFDCFRDAKRSWSVMVDESKLRGDIFTELELLPTDVTVGSSAQTIISSWYRLYKSLPSMQLMAVLVPVKMTVCPGPVLVGI